MAMGWTYSPLLCLTALLALPQLPHAYLVTAEDRKGGGGGLFRRQLPFAGKGACEEPVSKDELTTVRCLGPIMPMLPGQTVDAYVLLESPYPQRNVTVIRQEAQMVANLGNNTWRSVPLSELYFHHVVPNPRFLLGEGAEVRGSRLRKELQSPYAFMVDGKAAAEYDTRLTNIQLVNTKGVAPEHIQSAIECWCNTPQFGEEALRGSLFCCKQNPTNSTAGFESYQLEYIVTYRDVIKDEKMVDFFYYDVTGGKIEYNIAHAMGPNTSHSMAMETIVDKECPQQDEFEIVRCTAHQHVGSKCMHVHNADNGDFICKSCPVYGTGGVGEAGNENGYVVAINDDDLVTPYKMKPGTRIRVESLYDGSQKRLGVMGIMAIWVSGLTNKCNFQHSMAAQPPKMGMMQNPHTTQGDCVVAT